MSKQREGLIVTAVILLFFTVLAAAVRAQKPGKLRTPKVYSIEELSARLESQEQRIRQLESRRKGCFPYLLKSAAGEIECQDCQFKLSEVK